MPVFIRINIKCVVEAQTVGKMAIIYCEHCNCEDQFYFSDKEKLIDGCEGVWRTVFLLEFSPLSLPPYASTEQG